MNAYLDLAGDVIRRHIALAPAFAFAVAFLESLPFIGLFVPGTSLLLGLGAATAMSGGSLAQILAAAAVGAVLGTWISYEVGRRYAGRLDQARVFQSRPKMLAAGEALFHRHGAASVAIGRFLPVMRPMVPMIAGGFGLEPRRFHRINILSVLLWAPAFILPGALAGLTAEAVGGGSAFILLALTAALIGGAVLLRRVKLAPEKAAGQWRLAGLTTAGLLVIFVLALGVIVVSRPWVSQADIVAARWVFSLRTPSLDGLMVAASALGDGSQRTAATVLVASYLLWSQRWRWAVALVSVMAGAALATAAIKAAFHVARPSVLYSGVDAFSFPSGHASSAAALYLTLAWMAGRGLPRPWRPLVWTGAAAIVLLTAISRVYIGAHWPSDVVAGMALGGALAGLAMVYGATAAQPPSPRVGPAFDGLVFVAALLLVAGVQGPTVITKAQALYRPYLDAGPASLRE